MKKITSILPVNVNVPLILFIIFGVFSIQACNVYNSNNTNINGLGNGKGWVNINMTDQPIMYSWIVGITVNIDRIEIHEAGSDSTSGWHLLSDSVQTFNLLNLANGKSKLLATHGLKPGTYNQIRLTLGTSDTLTTKCDNYVLTIPNSIQNGIKINTNITVKAGSANNLLLDFNAAQSINQIGSGHYEMIPAIHPVDTQMDGMINGLIDPASAKSVILAVMNQDTVSTFADTTRGNFKMIGLTPGTYSLFIFPRDTTFNDTTLTKIQVNSRNSTNIGNIVLQQK